MATSRQNFRAAWAVALVASAVSVFVADLAAGDAPCVDPTPFRYSRLVDGTDLAVSEMM